MKTLRQSIICVLIIVTVIALVSPLRAQTVVISTNSTTTATIDLSTNAVGMSAWTVAGTTNAPVSTNTSVAPAIHTNTAIIPVRREDRAMKRTQTVLQRARENPGKCDIAFIGDSITQGWEGSGSNVWKRFYGKRKCLNFGVGGDRTQHVLWRFEQGQLDGLKPKAAVLMIGTNNSNKEDNTEADILEGVQLVVKQIRERLPDTKLIIVGIFPRGKTFSTQRGKILQVNQGLAKLTDGKMIHYIDFGSQLIEADGSISKTIMPDYLHLSEGGYEIWAQAIEPKLKELRIPGKPLPKS